MTGEPRQAAQSSYDALLWELRSYGLPRLNDRPTLDRLAALSSEQLEELIAALMRLRPSYDAVTDQLIQNLVEQQ